MIVGIHHIQITIPRGAEDEARAFYCGLLGLKEIDKPDSLDARGGFWLSVGDRQMHIGVEDGFDCNQSKSHIAYEVSDQRRWRSALTEHGVTCESGIPMPGIERFEFRDPFGNRVEMLQTLSDGTG